MNDSMSAAKAVGSSYGSACAAVGTTINCAPAAPRDEKPTSRAASAAHATVTTGSRAPHTITVGATMSGSFS